MLSRRHLRVKVLQALYAYFQSGNARIDQGEKQLLLSINKLYELYIYQLSFLVETTRFADFRLEENKGKHLPTAEDLNPNMRFAQNKILSKISTNRDFLKKEHLYKINWSEEKELVRRFYVSMRESDAYEQYMSKPVNSIEDDKKFVLYIIEHLFTEFELLQSFYEEKSIFFVDDYHLVSYLAMKFIKFMDKDFDDLTPLPDLLKTEKDDDNEDLDFVKELFRETIQHSDEWGKLIASSTSNWELERIAVMDVLILKMALTELTVFKSIPIKVSMNEYIDISKYFSTARSKVFVNGILDKLIVDMKASGQIVKTGRGLLDN
ncbi:MAG: N utilization substance protein B [Bacteroidetes bacterium]|nr:MAG: N utilization substance protein B [Bacteroidota bacterium]